LIEVATEQVAAAKTAKAEPVQVELSLKEPVENSEAVRVAPATAFEEVKISAAVPQIVSTIFKH